MNCECCTKDIGLFKKFQVLDNNGEFVEMLICMKCINKIATRGISNSELLYIHNCYLSGNRKQFIK